MPRALLTLAGVQAGWFACVLGAAAGYPLAGPLVVLLLIAAHSRARGSRPALATSIVCAVALGAASDGTLALAGLIRFPAQAQGGWPVPIWMLALWANLSLALEDMRGWLVRGGVAAALGAIGGPLAYLAAERLGAISLDAARTGSIAAIALEWAVAMPLLLWSDRLNRGIA
jgi:hypothetical protein